LELDATDYFNFEPNSIKERFDKLTSQSAQVSVAVFTTIYFIRNLQMGQIS
jgi:hypothetical protein